MLKELKQKIVEEVPEIMELKFGCRVTYGEKHEYYATFISWVSKTDKIVRVLDHTFYQVKKLESDWIKSVGRPITLEDVLRAGRCKLNASNFYITSQSKDTIISIVTDDYGDLDWWLHKPLSEQSKETIEFLYKLLCQTE